MAKKMRKVEADALLEEFAQQFLHAMDRAKLCGLPAERVRVVAEEAAVNWTPPKKPREKRPPKGSVYYVVRLGGRVTHDHHLSALTPEDAVKAAREKSPALRPEWVEEVGEGEEFEVLGACEACLLPLLEGRDEGKAVDCEGTLLCATCCKEAEEEAGEATS